MSRWRVTFVDAVSERRVELDVESRTLDAVRDAGWTLLGARRPTALVVNLVDIRAFDDRMPPDGEP